MYSDSDSKSSRQHQEPQACVPADEILHLDDSSESRQSHRVPEAIIIESSSCNSSGKEPVVASKKRRFYEANTEPGVAEP